MSLIATLHILHVASNLLCANGLEVCFNIILSVDISTDHTPPQKRSMVDKMSPLRWVRGKEETLSEINRKMQRALEEALMKNIHLQEVGFMWFLLTGRGECN